MKVRHTKRAFKKLAAGLPLTPKETEMVRHWRARVFAADVQAVTANVQAFAEWIENLPGRITKATAEWEKTVQSFCERLAEGMVQ